MELVNGLIVTIIAQMIFIAGAKSLKLVSTLNKKINIKKSRFVSWSDYMLRIDINRLNQ